MSEILLKSRLQEAMKAAMRAQEKDRLGVIRLILAQIKQIEVDERIDLAEDEARVLVILDKMLKQRRDSITQFEAANRQDLADKEHYEVSIIQTFMPQALDEAAVKNAIQEAVGLSGAQGLKDMKKVMDILKPKLQGRADMMKVGAQLKAHLEQL
jgi:uncharacterized protein YqeY